MIILFIYLAFIILLLILSFRTIQEDYTVQTQNLVIDKLDKNLIENININIKDLEKDIKRLKNEIENKLSF